MSASVLLDILIRMLHSMLVELNVSRLELPVLVLVLLTVPVV